MLNINENLINVFFLFVTKVQRLLVYTLYVSLGIIICNHLQYNTY